MTKVGNAESPCCVRMSQLLAAQLSAVSDYYLYALSYTQDGTIIAVDPSLKEQAAQAGSATIMVNTNKEVCAVHKAEGIGLNSMQFMR